MIWSALSLIFIILFFYYHNYFFLFIILGLIYLSYKRNPRRVFLVSQFIIFVFSIFNFRYFNSRVPIIDNENYTVIEKYTNYLILEKDNIKYIYYDDSLNIGNEVLVKGEVVEIELDSEFNKYLRTQNVQYMLKGNIIYNSNTISLQTRIKDSLLKDKDSKNETILKLVLFNQKDNSNSEFYKLFEKFSITFLLVISGFHINLLFKLFKKTKIIKYLIVLGYSYLLDFAVSSYKAFLYYVLKSLNKYFKLPFNNSDLLSFIMIAFLFINPSFCFNKGFIYSFSFSYLLDILNNTITKKGIRYDLLKKVIIYLASVPLMMLNNYQINSNSLIVNFLFTIPISFLFIFSFLYLFLDKFYLLYKIYITLLEYTLNILSRYSFDIVLGELNYIGIIALYGIILFIIFFYQNKMIKKVTIYFFIYIVFLVCKYYYPYIDPYEYIYFLDVGQGDCTIIKLKNSKKVIMIDTGGNLYSDIANNKIIPFLKSKGIKEIDTLIITHGDYDHMGASLELIENYKVNMVIFNDNEFNELELSLIEVLKENRIDYQTSNNMIIENSSVKLQLISNSKYDNENDNSTIVYANLNGLKILLMGDVSEVVEEELIEKYNFSNIHILKVSHHGSDSGNSKEFINAVAPSYSIISVGENNRYGHPNISILENLKNSIIYRTDKNGTIIFKLLKNKLEINTLFFKN